MAYSVPKICSRSKQMLNAYGSTSVLDARATFRNETQNRHARPFTRIISSGNSRENILDHCINTPREIVVMSGGLLNLLNLQHWNAQSPMLSTHDVSLELRDLARFVCCCCIQWSNLSCHRVRPIRPSLFVDKINEGGAAEDLSVHMMTLV